VMPTRSKMNASRESKGGEEDPRGGTGRRAVRARCSAVSFRVMTRYVGMTAIGPR